MADKPVVIQTEHLDTQAADWLAQRVNLSEIPFAEAARLRAALPEAQGLVVRTYTKVDADLLAHAPRLKVVARAGVGLDNIDVQACRARGVQVVYTPDANSSAVVELVFAVLLDAIRPRLFLDKSLDAAAWANLRKELLGRRQLETMTLGILGLGRVGSRVARVGAAFGMTVLYHDLRDIPESSEFGARPVPFEKLLAESDALTIHVDGRASNRNLLAEAQFGRMKPDAVFVNASRGMVVDHAALARHLTANPSASAILDVHEPEPIAPDNPLLGLKNAHLMPHIGAATAKAHENMSWVVRDVWRVLEGVAPQHPAP
ncbi:MAG: phosphoglycerate dehydrogenase [Tepidisphaera sp.]